MVLGTHKRLQDTDRYCQCVMEKIENTIAELTVILNQVWPLQHVAPFLAPLLSTLIMT